MAGSFNDVWNPAYEGLPSDNEAINLGANRIRDFKVNTRERIAIDHSFAGDVNDGKHVQSTYRVATVDPTLDATDGAVYAKAVGGETELFYKDSAGNVTQLTASGHLYSPFPSGTFMLFMQSAPPPGWTQYASVNDAMIRVVSGGGGGGTGGSWTLSGVTVSTSVTTTTSTTVNVTGVNMSLTLNPISLSISNLPFHVHSLSQVQITSTPGSGSPSFYPAQLNTGAALGQGPATDATGSNDPFTPTGSITFNSATASASSSSSSPATTSFSNDGTWRPAYVNVIAATKN